MRRRSMLPSLALASLGVAATAAPSRTAADDAEALAFARADPRVIENEIYERISAVPGLELTSLTSVECGPSRCTIAFSGNPESFSVMGLTSAVNNPPWRAFRMTQGGFGRRELSPGIEEYVFTLTYVALVDASHDAPIAARQHAACAGAWTRVTALRGSNDYMRQAREQAARHLEIAARALGRADAERIAEQHPLGPLTRDCHATPY